MTTSRRRDMQVFDFNEEDEVVDLAFGKKLEKFKTPSPDDQSTLKCEFLGHVSQLDKTHVKDVGSILCVDDDALSDKFDLENGVSDPPVGASEKHLNNKEKFSELEVVQQSNFIRLENPPRLKLDVRKYEDSTEHETEDTSGDVPSPRMGHTDPTSSGSPSSNESIDVNSEAGECMNESPPSSPTSEIAENVSMNGYGSNLFMDNSEMGVTNMDVVLHPDYVIYRNSYFTGPQLIFSHSCVKINGSTASLKQGTFNLEWAVDDLIDIKCQLFQNNGMVMIKLRVISNVAGDSDNVNGTSGIEELKIVVSDSCWSMRHKLITSLNVKYVAIWNVVFGTDMEDDKSDSLGPSSYFPNFDKPFEEIIYPKGDPDAVSLSKRDVDLLQPDTFVNDTIIDFYIKYLKNQIQEEEMHRFHFFNSFFFRKLADMDKNPSSASDGKAAFLRVRKWTRKINLFEKDYIFIPVNFNLHWSLIVICHPGEVVSFNDEDRHQSLKVPCILHMDSIKGTHSGLKNLLQSYLLEEWKERQKDTWEEALSSRFFNMRFLPVAVPQQENSFDCGLFLLHYLELFLAEAPVNFNPFKLTKFSNFLNEGWFHPAEAYLKRTLIQKLISELLKNRSYEASSSNYSDDNQYSEHNENQTGIEFLAERRNPEINAESIMSHAGQGIEMTLLSSSSMDPRSFNNSGFVLRELFEPGSTEGTLLGQCQSFDHRSSDYRLNSSMFPIEDDAENNEQFMYLTTDANFQQVARISTQTCELPYLSRSCRAETSHKLEISLQAELDKDESSPDTSSRSSDDSDEIGIIENCPIGHEAESSQKVEEDEKNCSSMENLDCISENAGFVTSNLPIASIVECSQDPDTVHHNNENGVLGSSCEEASITPLHQVFDAVDDKVTCDDVQMIDDVAPDRCEEQAAKRRRLMSLACESDCAGVLPEESHL